MEDDAKHQVDESSREVAGLRRKRLMLVSRRRHSKSTEPTKLDQRFDGNTGSWAGKLGGIAQTPHIDQCRHSSAEAVEETDYILESLHKLKRWMKRIGRWTQCYSQYCYPGFRTVEYYRRVKENQKRKRKCVTKKPSKRSRKLDNTGKGEAAALASPSIQHQAENYDEVKTDTSAAQNGREDIVAEACSSTPQVMYHSIEDRENLIPIKTALNRGSDESILGWTDYLSKRFNDVVSRTLALYFQDDEPFQVAKLLKWVYVIVLPAVLLLGMHYVVLRRKYKHLSGKLRRAKDENHVLVKESNKLELALISTEKLTKSVSTKETRAQAVAEFTRLSESLVNSKRELNQMTTERTALLEELKMARRKRDEARKRFSSLNCGMMSHQSTVKS